MLEILDNLLKSVTMINEISNCIFRITEEDLDLDLFESQYPIPTGITYNSYVIIDEKIAVMDTMDARVTEKWMSDLKTILGDRKIDYLIVSHMEPDHAANIGYLIQNHPEIRLVGNAKTFGMIQQFFDIDIAERSIVVDEGESLDLGEHKLTFFMAPMVHWPEVMVTYESLSKSLFSADGFGRFGPMDEKTDWESEARRYYFNIVGKYGAPVQKLLAKASELDICRICPLHGPVLENNLGRYIELYDTWSSYRPEKKGVAIVCASIYGNTLDVAKKMEKLIKSKGSDAILIDITRNHISYAIEAAFTYDSIIIASSTYEGGLFPVMGMFLSELKSKKFQNRKVGIIENGTWAPMSGRLIKDAMTGLQSMTICEPMITIRSSMKKEDEKSMDELASNMIA